LPIYELSGLKKLYRDRSVLDVARLDIEEGEVLALVGPSGAGKSTLLRLLNFLETPTSGAIRFAGQSIGGAAPLSVRRQVTTVFQRPILQRGSVRSNVAYGLHLRGLHADGRVDDALAQVGLVELANYPAQTLSGGEMQRVALARALVFEPRVLLLDEPTANLDPYNVALIENLIREQNRRRGTTVVMVTHNVFQARRLAARTGLLLGGALVELAPTAQFFGAPLDARTSAFVRGDMVY
jgi:tungstate transport system ATP-binding protein